MYTGSSGLSVAYLSGVEGLTPSPTCFTPEDATALHVPLTSSSKFQGVDVLLTSQWPRGVEKYATQAVSTRDVTACTRDLTVSTGDVI